MFPDYKCLPPTDMPFKPLRQSQAHLPPAKGATSDHQCPRGLCKQEPLDVFTLRARNFVSSSWLSKASIFRQENRQSYYRNDPVKYDLSVISDSKKDSPFCVHVSVRSICGKNVVKCAI